MTERSRQKVWTLELELDRCTRTYGVLPCRAVLGEPQNLWDGGVGWLEADAGGETLGALGSFGGAWTNYGDVVFNSDNGHLEWQDSDSVLQYTQRDITIESGQVLFLSMRAERGADTTYPYPMSLRSGSLFVGAFFGDNGAFRNIHYLGSGSSFSFGNIITSAITAGTPATYNFKITRNGNTITIRTVVIQGENAYAGETEFNVSSWSDDCQIRLGGALNAAVDSWDDDIWQAAYMVRASDSTDIPSDDDMLTYSPQSRITEGTGNAQCYNTLETCQDPDNYERGGCSQFEQSGADTEVQGGVETDGEGWAVFGEPHNSEALLVPDVQASDGDTFVLLAEVQRGGGDNENRYIFALRAHNGAQNEAEIGITSNLQETDRWFLFASVQGGLALYTEDLAQTIPQNSQTVVVGMQFRVGGGDLQGVNGGAVTALSNNFITWVPAGDDLDLYVGGAPGQYNFDGRIRRVVMVRVDTPLTDAELRAARPTHYSWLDGGDRKFSEGVVAALLWDGSVENQKKRGNRLYLFCSEGALLDGHQQCLDGRYSDRTAGLRTDFRMWERGRFECRLHDFHGSDTLLDDDYLHERDQPHSPVGSYFGRLFARNRHFSRRRAVVRVGHVGDDGEVDASFTRYMRVRSFVRDGRDVRLQLDDGLRLTEDEGAVIPPPSDILLAADVGEDATTLTFVGRVDNLLDRAIGTEPPSTDSIRHVRVGDEIMSVEGEAHDGDTNVTTLTVGRGAAGTEADSHDAGDTVFACYTAEGRNVTEVLEDVLLGYCDIGKALLDAEGFAQERNSFLSTVQCSGIISEPTGCDKIIEELQRSGLFGVWHDAGDNSIKIASILSLSFLESGVGEIGDDHMVADSLRLREEPDKSPSRVLVYYDPLSQAEVGDDANNWKSLYVAVNGQIELEIARGSVREVRVRSRWIGQAQAREVADRLILTGEVNFGLVEFTLPIGELDVQVGQNVPIRSWKYPDASGQPTEYVVRVMRLDSSDGETLRVTAVRTNYGGSGYLRPFRIGESLLGGEDVIV